MSRHLLLAALCAALVSSPARAGDDLLDQRIESIRRQVGARRIAVAFHDHQTGRRYVHRADEMFHAASTIKVPVLVAVFTAIAQGRLELETAVPVTNRFRSLADGSPYTIPRESGPNALIHDAIGKT